MNGRRKILVIFESELPEKATADELKEFIRDAVTTAGGSRHPFDPFFESIICKKLHTRLLKVKNRLTTRA